MNKQEIIHQHYSEMNKKRWKEIDSATRAKMMSELAKKRWGKMTPEQRSKYAIGIGLGGDWRKRKAQRGRIVKKTA